MHNNPHRATRYQPLSFDDFSQLQPSPRVRLPPPLVAGARAHRWPKYSLASVRHWRMMSLSQ